MKHGGNVNAKDNMEQTALHWAAVRGSIAAADVLLENGARVEAADLNGYRVLFSLFIIYFFYIIPFHYILRERKIEAYLV